MKPQNLLFLLSDQHTRAMTGCYGHPLAQTPSLDRLAAAGTRFAHAYTNCPICVPARASLATGRYVHQIGYWDNGFPYEGSVPSWGHHLKDQGYRVDSIGKLHFRSSADDNGFTEEIDPLHVVDGIGDILGCIRQDPPLRSKRDEIEGAGPGDSTYLRYDQSNADRACQWLERHTGDSEPWVLFLSFVCPHPPYIAPPELFDLYPPAEVPLASQWRPGDWPDHPAQDYFRRFFHFDRPFDEEALRRVTATYLGVVTYLDRRIGQVLQALEKTGLSASTRVLYTSDHGESMGARGLFGKFTMYDEAVSVPLILAGADVPRGKVVETPVSLIDCFPTVLEAVGASPPQDQEQLPGKSLWQTAAQEDGERTVLSEYHAVGSRHAIYMLRDCRYKYVHYQNDRPQLFDLVEDPCECRDLAARQPAVVKGFERRLGTLLDPEATDRRAKTDQTAKVEAAGGKEAVIRRGSFPNSPVPGEEPDFRNYV